jgi:hypothetical protein
VSEQQPVAWLFKNPDGSVRFVIHDQARAEAWRSAHQGEIVPLYDKPQDEHPAKPTRVPQHK